MAAVAALLALLAAFAFVDAAPSASLDASSSVPEAVWFHAENEWAFLTSWCERWEGDRKWMCLDCFSASRKLASRFRIGGYPSVSYDIKNDEQQDVTTRSGFLMLLGLGMELCDCGLLMLQPPCSLFVGISQGTHKRSLARLKGDESFQCVRLSNIIYANMVSHIGFRKLFVSMWGFDWFRMYWPKRSVVAVVRSLLLRLGGFRSPAPKVSATRANGTGTADFVMDEQARDLFCDCKRRSMAENAYLAGMLWP